MTSPETSVSEAEVEAAARTFALLQPDAFSSSSRSDVPCSANWPGEFGAREQDGFRATARAALTAAAQVRAQEETVVLDSYAAENQRFYDHIERLQAALQSIISNDCWNNKIYSGNDAWNYGACAKIAQAALGIRKGE